MKKELILNKCNNIYCAAKESAVMLKHINNGNYQFVILDWRDRKDTTLEDIIFLAEAHDWEVKIVEI